MKNETVFSTQPDMVDSISPKAHSKNAKRPPAPSDNLPEILFVTSYPPRECGIATYSQDLLKALHNKFSNSFALKVCALEAGKGTHSYQDEVKYVLDTTNVPGYAEMALTINADKRIQLVMVQHEFGFFGDAGEDAFLQFLYRLTKPIILVFHTVLPQPDEALQLKVRHIAAVCDSIVVMTHNAAKVLRYDYGVPQQKIVVIPHGTHLVPHLNKDSLKEKYGLSGRKVLSTFGLLSSGKSIETTLNALPSIIEKNPDVSFLVIGKTHPGVVKSQGEQYRTMLEEKVKALHLEDHVKFINHYLPLKDLLEYLQLTDIYLFTSKDPNQAVSGTFSYAMSCACPIISTPIPHAMEVLRDDTGIIIDFQNSKQLADAVNRLMGVEELRMAFSSSTLQRIVPTAWENSAISHALLLQQIAGAANGTTAPGSNLKIDLKYRRPEINLDHLKKMTTDFGILQFSKINQPDPDSGYTLDDNARALVAMCMHFELSGNEDDLKAIRIYLEFIKFCQQPEGYFLNYVDMQRQFTSQNDETNLADAHGRAIWALGYLLSRSAFLPDDLAICAEDILARALPRTKMMYSTRSMAFAIKGLYYANQAKSDPANTAVIEVLAHRLVQMYRHESERNWLWFESYLTYANSILPEAMLCAWLETGEPVFKEIAKTSFDFLLSLTFNASGIKVISNRSWMQKGEEAAAHGEQPIDVAYTILALDKFYSVFNEAGYLNKMSDAFNWFLGKNHLHQIIYNPCTGGCYDGLEETHVNLNQGAESTVSYLMARLTVEKQKNE
jgi:glycosyltransferase involved in cell wall biosynthesis